MTVAIFRLARWIHLWHAARVQSSPPIRAEVSPEDRVLAVRALARGGLIDKHPARLRAWPAHGNRTLHLDQLFLGMLLSFFDPLVRPERPARQHLHAGGPGTGGPR
jgi:hypothetical protein